MRNVVHQFLENKMDIPSSCVSHCRRLGKAKHGSSHPRPILVVFDSIESKHSVMKNRKKLAGTNIYIKKLSGCRIDNIFRPLSYNI